MGYLSSRSGPLPSDEAFREGLRELGYVEGQNIAIEYRWADFKPARAATLAAELVRLKVDVIVPTGGLQPALAAKRAGTTIPIPFAVSDPVGAGLVTGLDRPGGNLTGVTIFTGELDAKRLELLKGAVPSISSVAILANTANPRIPGRLNELKRAARVLQVKLHVLEAREQQEIDVAFAAMARDRAQALLVMHDPWMFAQKERIIELANKHRLPGIFPWREFPEAGGLLSYGTNIAEMYRRLATHVDKILKGTKPADLPIEQPAKFEFVINLRTAKTLRLTIPKSVLDRADHVIE